MGIKHFFYWFKNQFNKNIKKFNKNDYLNIDIDNLLLDMNGIFHNSTQKIYRYGNYKDNPRLLSGKKIPKVKYDIKTQIAVFKDVCEYVEMLLHMIKPKKRIILCVDGPAPLSKQNQQRQRRFRSSLEYDGKSFNSSCITPGTKFMDYLSKYIDWYIRKRINEKSIWANIEVIFSNEKAPGEGEHKLISYIRQYGDLSETYCINGLDADLIMLVLGTHVENFYIIREDMYNPQNDFFCIDIKRTRSDLIRKMHWKSNKFLLEEKSIIDDFVFLCFTVGNDFLPHIPSIEIIEDGIELIIQVYKEVATDYGHITKRDNNKVRFIPKSLSVFLGTIGMYEKSNLEKKLMSKRSFFPDLLLQKHANQSNKVWVVDIDSYINSYLTKHFHGTEEKISHMYLEGLQWVLSYYTNGVPDWKWSFKYHYAPPASILAKYLTNFKFVNYIRTIPTTPFQQLLCVLPPKSAYLIPKPLCDLLINETSPLKKFCPDKFHIDLSGKMKEWEGTVILPMVDFDIVRNSYLDLIDKVKSADIRRNIAGRTFVYKKVDTERTFNSYYGDIEKSKVTIECIDL